MRAIRAPLCLLAASLCAALIWSSCAGQPRPALAVGTSTVQERSEPKEGATAAPADTTAKPADTTSKPEAVAKPPPEAERSSDAATKSAEGGADTTGRGTASGASATADRGPADRGAAGVPAASRPQAQVSGLRAGYADDNKQYNYFVKFLETYSAEADHQQLDISERIILRVLDSSAKPLANADVAIYAGQNLVQRARSYADGTVLFFPRARGVAEQYRVVTTALGRTVESVLDRQGKREVEITVPAQRRAVSRVPLDIVFVLDTTGSMGEEIERLKLTIELINMNLTSLPTNPLVRFGLVLYRDVGDEYVTRVVQPTENLQEFQNELAQVYADGGGDTPEDLQSALRDTVNEVHWNQDGLRLAFVVTDAPPHLDYTGEQSYVDSVLRAQEKGIKIYSVGTGGLDIGGEYVLRQVSQYTYAKYIFLTYGEQGESEGGAAGSVSHHTGANFQTDKLETIIIRFAREELAFQSDRPLEQGEEYFEAVKVTDEQREETLGKLFDMAIQQLADFSSAAISRDTRVASVPLQPQEAALGAQAEYLSEQLVLSLSRSKLFRMVERKDLQKILGELELQLSGLVDDTQAAKVGSVMGAQMLVTGTLYARDDRYELFLKLLRVETGEILSVTKARVDRKLAL